MSTKRHVKYPKTTQLRNAIKDICHMSTYVGKDEDGEPIFDNNKPKPVLEFTGTVKLHGTNAGVSHNIDEGMWIQSRKNIITPEKDNDGFAFFVESKRDIFEKFFDELRSNLKGSIYPDDTITIYGEWAGKGIQGGVGINQIDKAFYIFGVKLSPANVITIEGDPNADTAYWIKHTDLRSPENRIYNITDFKTFKISIDFNNPGLIQNDLIAFTEEVERECPVSKQLGAEGEMIGEGIVWTTKHNGNTIRFKVKGEAHTGAKSKVKVLTSVDEALIRSIIDFAINYGATEGRLSQMFKEICNDVPDRKYLGDFLRAVVSDTIVEEADIMNNFNLEPKQVGKKISELARNWFFEKENL